MSHHDDFDHPEDQEGSEEESRLQNGIPDNEYYSFLNVPRSASQDEISGAYKKLSRLYHPDKYRDEEKKKHAEILFTKLQKAYSILGDPHKRAIYDCLGKEGIDPQVWDLIPRTKTPKEIREEFEAIAKAREERELQRRTNPTSRLVMRIDASDIFERYMYEEIYDDVYYPSLPTLSVSGIELAQTIEAPISLTEKVVIYGNLNTNRGKGQGSVGCTLHRATSSKSWHEVDLSFGGGPTLGGKFFYKLPKETWINISGGLHAGNGMQPSLGVTLGTPLTNRTRGTLTYQTNCQIYEDEHSLYLEEEQSGINTMVIYNSDKYHLATSLQIGIPQTYFSLNFARKFKEPYRKIRGSLKFGTFGAVIEYGVDRKITEQSTLAATVAVGIPQGVVLRIRLNRASQTYLFPLHLSDEVLFQPLFYGTVTPLLAWFAVKKFILDPWEAKKKQKAKEEEKMEKMSRMAEARKDAMHSVELMRERYSRICSDEMAKNGLIVILALYGKLLKDDDSSDELSPEVTAVLEANNEGPLNDQIMVTEDVINVTIPVQCLVEESSRIILYEGSKSGLAGFFDPCNTDDEDDSRHLLIRYSYQGKIHQTLIKDQEQLRCPRSTHQLLNS